jgi:peroxidase
LLPFNTDGLENAGGKSNTNLFLAGEVRVNEQVGLTAIHTLFVREHNRLAERIKAVGYSNADDEKIYHLARLLVIAEVQIITYREFLPALLGNAAPKLEDYQFQNSVNPQLSNEFSTAIFRFGHSMLSKKLFLPSLTSEQTDEWIELRKAFFNVGFFTAEPSNIDRILIGLTTTEAQEIDSRVVEDVRSFLFSKDGLNTFCLDLVALNIQRGRDHQIPPYNEIRRGLGLPVKTSFDQITQDEDIQRGLRQVYGSVDVIDPWIGALAEDHLPGCSVGELLTTAIAKQFVNLRDGDPLFFRRTDPIYNIPRMEAILDLDKVSLGFLMEQNTQAQGLDRSKIFFTEIIDDGGPGPTAPSPTPPPTRVRTDGPVGEDQCHKWILQDDTRFSTRLNARK